MRLVKSFVLLHLSNRDHTYHWLKTYQSLCTGLWYKIFWLAFFHYPLTMPRDSCAWSFDCLKFGSRSISHNASWIPKLFKHLVLGCFEISRDLKIIRRNRYVITRMHKTICDTACDVFRMSIRLSSSPDTLPTGNKSWRSMSLQLAMLM